MRMQLYLESADPGEVGEALHFRVVDGVTTNPALLAKVGGDPHIRLRELCEMVSGPVLASVTSLETESMVAEALALAEIHEHMVVKLPCLPAALPAMAELAERRVPVEATLCFSLSQALLSAKAGVHFVSPMVGRLEESGQDGLTLVGNILTMYDQYQIKTRVIAGGCRTATHVAEAARMGADAATLPLSLLRNLAAHPLSIRGQREFAESWRKGQN
jgi:transaldolase